MKRFILFSLYTVILFMLQMVWREHFPLFNTGPNLVLLVILYMAAFHEPTKGLAVAFLLGFATDVVTGYHLGLYATIYTVVFFGMYQWGRNFYLRSIIFQLLAAVVAILSFKVLEFTMLSAFEVAWSVRWQIWRSMPWQLLVTAAAAPIVFRPLLMIEDLATPSLMRSGGGFSDTW